MKLLKLFITSIVFVGAIMANEIQVFTKNTMDLPLDSKTVTEKIYSGKYDDFMKNPKKYLSKGFAAATANGAFVGAYNSTNAINAMGKSDFSQVGIGAITGLAVYGAYAAGSWFVSDNQYLYLTLAINSKGKKTMIQTLIVANNSLSDNEIEKIAKKELKAQIK